MMMHRIENSKGFTLLEIIMVLILTGILAAVIGLAVVNMSKGYLSARNSASTMQKGEIAVARMIKELSNIKVVDSANTNQTKITFTSYLNSDTLTDSVSGFALTYYDSYNGTAQTTWTATKSIISITLTMTGAQGIPSVFTALVALTGMLGA
jgi:prepilin-type N-terminal cleavage/methylation domain-containing protein